MFILVTVKKDDGAEANIRLNTDKILFYDEVLEASPIADAMGGDCNVKKTAVILGGGAPLVIEESVDFLDEILLFTPNT